MYKLGIDIGASHIGLGIYDDNKKKLIKKKYIPYKHPNKIFNYVFNRAITKKYVKSLIRKIDTFIGDYKIEYIGVGCPGGVDIERSIFFGSKGLVVGKIDFQKSFKKYNCPVYVDNDCNCAAVGEASVNDFDKFLMITIGTGVGFSLIRKTRKRILLAKDEVIWQILKINKVPNTKNDKYIKSFKKLSNEYNKRQGVRLPREAIFSDVRNNKDLIGKYIDDFVMGIDLIDKKIKIKNICIGGSLSLYKRYYLRELQRKLEKHEVFIAKNFNDAGIIGAVSLPIKRY